MPYDYNRYRRKRIESEQQLTLAQMMQTVLIEEPFVSGSLFKYAAETFAKGDGKQTPIGIGMDLTGATYSSTPIGLSLDATTGVITPAGSTVEIYTVTVTLADGEEYSTRVEITT